MIKDKNVLCVIPVRSGSKGLKDKNIRLVAGKPLLEYAIDASIKSKFITDICLSSDSEKILDHSSEEIIKVKRPAELSRDDSSSHSVIYHAINYLENKLDKKYDYGIIVQVTNPLVLAEDIDGVIKLMFDNNLDSCISIVKIEGFDLEKIFLKDSHSLLKSFSGSSPDNFKRRQDLSEAFTSNGSCFAANRETILSGKLLGSKCGGYLVDKARHMDIDDEQDLKLADLILTDKENK